MKFHRLVARRVTLAVVLLVLGGCASAPVLDPAWGDRSCGEMTERLAVLEDTIKSRRTQYAVRSTLEGGGVYAAFFVHPFTALALPFLALWDTSWEAERAEHTYLSALAAARGCR